MSSKTKTKRKRNVTPKQPIGLYDVIRYFLAHDVHPHQVVTGEKVTWYIVIRSDALSKSRMRTFLNRDGVHVKEHPGQFDYPAGSTPVDIPPEEEKKGDGRGRGQTASKKVSLAPISDTDIQRALYQFFWLPEDKKKEVCGDESDTTGLS